MNNKIVDFKAMFGKRWNGRSMEIVGMIENILVFHVFGMLVEKRKNEK